MLLPYCPTVCHTTDFSRILKGLITVGLISKEKVITFHPQQNSSNFFKTLKISGFHTNMRRFGD